MNKVLLSAAAGSLFCGVGFVNADHSAVSVHEEPVVVEQPSEPEPAPVEAAYVCPLTGFYVTAGIGGSFYKHKKEENDTLTFLDDHQTTGYEDTAARDKITGEVVGDHDLIERVTAIDAAAGAELGLGHRITVAEMAAKDARIADVVSSTPAGLAFLNRGREYIAFNDEQKKLDLDRDGTVTRNVSSSLNHSRFIGTLGLGGGKAFDSGFYAGLEALFDFGSSKAKSGLKLSAVSPSLGLRLGYFNRNAEMLFYAKVAASHVSLKTEDKAFSVSKFAPALALGIEKAFTKKVSGRLEGEYRFASKGTFNTKRPHTDLETKLKTSGWNIRALVSYNINGI